MFIRITACPVNQERQQSTWINSIDRITIRISITIKTPRAIRIRRRQARRIRRHKALCELVVHPRLRVIQPAARVSFIAREFLGCHVRRRAPLVDDHAVGVNFRAVRQRSRTVRHDMSVPQLIGMQPVEHPVRVPLRHDRTANHGRIDIVRARPTFRLLDPLAIAVKAVAAGRAIDLLQWGGILWQSWNWK